MLHVPCHMSLTSPAIATYPPLSYYPHWSRDSVSNVCGIFKTHFLYKDINSEHVFFCLCDSKMVKKGFLGLILQMTLVRCTQEVSVKPFTCSCKCIVRCGLVKWSTVMLSSRSREEGCSLYITQCCSVVAWVWCPPSIVISSALFTGFSTDWQRTHWHWNSGQHQENKNWKILLLRIVYVQQIFVLNGI